MYDSTTGRDRPAPTRPDREGRSYSVDTLEPLDFDRILAGFDDTCFDQLATYRSGQWPGRIHTFVSYRDGRPVGGAVLVAFAAPMLGRGVADLRFGPFWRRHGEAPDPADHDAIVKQLIREFAVRRGHMLTIRPRPSPDYTRLESETLVANGFRRRPAPDGAARYLVDVTIPEAEQMRSLDAQWRLNLSVARDAGVEVVHDDSDPAIAAFQDMHRRMVQRRNIGIVEPTHLIGPMIRDLPAPMKPRNFLAFHRGEPVAGAIVMNTGDTAHCVFGAREEKALALKAGHALQWEIVRSLGTQPVRYYDLGGESGHEGLRRFKNGLAGAAGATIPLPDEFDHWSRADSFLLGRSFQLARYVKRAMA